MALRHIEVGGTRVDLLRDGVFTESQDKLIHNGGSTALASALARRGSRPIRIDVNCFLLRGPRGVELVDAGTGPSRGPDYGWSRAALADLGVTPPMVDRVYVTHLHFDHVLGLLDGDAAYFPRAEVIVPAADLDYHTDLAERARLPDVKHPTFDNAARIVDAYGERLRRTSFEPLTAEVELLPIPGHTSGQGAYVFTAGAATLLLFGDLLHLEGEQAEDPDLALVYDHDPVTAARSRREVLARAADRGWTAAGGHTSGFGRVSREGDGFRFAPL